MFRALKFRKIPAVMVRFPGESHELSRSGQPWHRVERLQHIVGWFDHWLMGTPKPEYEIGRRKKRQPRKAARWPNDEWLRCGKRNADVFGKRATRVS